MHLSRITIFCSCICLMVGRCLKGSPLCRESILGRDRHSFFNTFGGNIVECISGYPLIKNPYFVNHTCKTPLGAFQLANQIASPLCSFFRFGLPALVLETTYYQRISGLLAAILTWLVPSNSTAFPCLPSCVHFASTSLA